MDDATRFPAVFQGHFGGGKKKKFIDWTIEPPAEEEVENYNFDCDFGPKPTLSAEAENLKGNKKESDFVRRILDRQVIAK